MVDIKLNDMWCLTKATNGDAPTVIDIDCFLQDVKLEALTQEGELFYDESYGWSLMDFMQCENDELTIIEIKNRVREKLSKRELITSESIRSEITFTDDLLCISASFKIIGNNRYFSMEIAVERIKVEVENA